MKQTAASAPHEPVWIETPLGRICGERVNGYQLYRGIPYAKAPVGNRRFLPPQPITAWEGDYEALTFGARSMQPDDPAQPCRKAGYSEDSLYLNICVSPGVQPGERVPVVVFFHGGGHYAGSGIEEFLDAPNFLAGEKLIFVTINYRLGALGYLYLGHLLGEAYAFSGSLGLMDQIAALKFVKAHIAAFGGDEKRIMLMGISAGAKSISAVLASPSARGLFAGALIQSGGVQCIREEKTAQAITARFLSLAGLTPQTAARLLRMDSQEIIRVQSLLCEQIYNNHVFGPVAGKGPVPADFVKYLHAGALADVPILAGFSREELYPARSLGDDAPDEQDVAKALVRVFGENAAHVYGVYERLCQTGTSYRQAFYRCMSDYVYRNPGKVFARLLSDGGAKVWAYEWAHPVDGYARHGSEMDYLFGRMKGTEPGMCEKIAAIWRHFLQYGQAAAPGTPDWRRLDEARPTRLEIDEKLSLLPLAEDPADDDMPLQALKLE